MVYLSLDSLEILSQEEHLATDWEVSDRADFSNIVLSSIEDRVNKTNIIFGTNLDPNTKWYARARALLTTGYTELSNIYVFVPETDVVAATGEDIPSRIAIPLITTNSNPKDHELCLFEIYANGFTTLGNATHYATSWWIEDLDGVVIWSSLDNTIYLNKLPIVDVILKPNSVYTIKAMFHSTSNDHSPIGAYSIYTRPGADIELLNYLDNVQASEDIKLMISKFTNMERVEWELYEYVKDGVYEYTEDDNYDTVVVDEFKGQGKWGVLPLTAKPIEYQRCKNVIDATGEVCNGTIAHWDRFSVDASYNMFFKKFKLTKKFVEMFRDAILLANNKLQAIIDDMTPTYACSKCNTAYYDFEDLVVAVPIVRQTNGVTSIRAVPGSVYRVRDYLPETNITSLGVVSSYTWQQELNKNLNYNPPNDMTVNPLKGVTYKQLVMTLNAGSFFYNKLTSYGIALNNQTNRYSLIKDYMTIDSTEGTLTIPNNAADDANIVIRGFLFYTEPVTPDLTELKGVRYWNFTLMDHVVMPLPYGSIDILNDLPTKFFLRYPHGGIVANPSKTSDGNAFIRYTYDRKYNLKVVGYIEYNTDKQPTKWANEMEDEVTYVKLPADYTDDYFQGLNKTLEEVVVWY